MPYADTESLRRAIGEVSQKEVSKAYEEVKTILEDYREEISKE